MSRLLTCPQGHAWQAADGDTPEAPCPICGGPPSPWFEERKNDPQKTQPLQPLDGPIEIPIVPGYEILAEVGRGGMGVVYRARQKGLNRLVALKMILAGAHAGPDTLARFRAEAEAVAQLQHPHIVQIYEVNEYDGRPYFSLEYVEGGSLAERLNGTPQPPDAAARLVRTLAEAIHVAHQRGIVHRDLKPGNILLSFSRDPEGSASDALPSGSRLNKTIPKITDFGLAKRLDLPAANTQSGSLLGTPQYMAPEQASGHNRAVGPPADIHALGAMLYEMLTGRPPFVAATALDTLMQVVQQEPVPPRRLNPKVPRDLDTICLKCLQKEPHKRYESAQALADDLGRFLNGQPILARPIGVGERFARWCRRNPVIAALTVAVAVLLPAASVISTGAAVHIARARDQAERSADDARRAQKQAEEAAAGEREARDAAETHRRLAAERLALLHVAGGGRALDAGDLFGALPWFAAALQEAEGDPEQETLQRTRLGAVLRQLPRVTQVWFPEGGAQSVALSRDGGRLLIVSRSEARVWDVVSGAAVTLPFKPAPGSSLVCGAFSADGRRIALAGRRRIAEAGRIGGEARVWDAQTGKPLTPPMLTEEGITEVAFASDDTRLLTLGSWWRLSRRQVRVWDAKTGQLLLAPEPGEDNEGHAVLSNDGRRLLTYGKARFRLDRDYQVRLWNVDTGKPLAISLKATSPIEFAAFSPDGRLVVTTGAEGARLWDAASGQPFPIVLGQHDATRFSAFSPDGRQLLTLGEGSARLWDPGTGKPLGVPLRLTAAARAWFTPSGHRILTTSSHTGLGAARVWDSAGGSPLTPPLPHDAAWPALFGPDARRVVTGGPHGSVWIWDTAVMAHAAPALNPLNGVGEVAFSPDGRRALTVTYREARVWDAVTGAPITPPLTMPKAIERMAFSPDGSRVLTVSRGADERGDWWGTARVWDAATGQPLTPLLTHPGGSFNATAAFSPDGRWLATGGGALNAGEARVWEAATGQPVSPLLTFLNAVRHVAFSPDGRLLLVITGNDLLGEASLHDATTGRPAVAALAFRGNFHQAVFTPDGSRVILASRTETHVWESATGRDRLLPLPNRPASVVLSADGSRLVTDMDTEVRVWDTASGKEAAPALRPGEDVHVVALSRDGSRLVATTGAGTPGRWQWRLWDATTGEPLTLPGDDHHLLIRAAFSPDNRRLSTTVLTDQHRHEVRLWDASTGQPLTPLLPHENDVTRAEFSPDGRSLLTASPDGGWLWDLSADERPRDDLVELAHFLSRQRIHATGGCLPVEWDRADLERRCQALRQAYPRNFAVAPAEVLAWHRREANRCQSAHQWAALVTHLDPLLEAEPNAARLVQWRARAQAELGHWREAAADFERDAALEGQDTPWALENAALARLAAGDREGYRRDCADLLKRIEDPKSTFSAEAVASVCTLAPGAVADTTALLRLAERLMKEDPDDARLTCAAGMCLYRVGRYAEARERLKAAAAGENASIRSLLCLALASAQAGKPDEARQGLARAAEAETKEIAWVSWDQRLERRLLREEAEKEIR
jgi:WD40 repeat protein